MTNPSGSDSLPGLIDRRAASDPDREAIFFQGRSLTYARLNQRINRAAALLVDRGVGPGDRVGLVMANQPDNVAYFPALLKIGAIEVGFSPETRPETVAAALAETGAEAALYDDKAGRLVEAVRDRSPRVEFIAAPELASGPATRFPDRGDPEAVGLIQYTSGSTGLPKGVALTQAAFLAASRWRSGELNLTERDRVFNAVRLAHSCGKSLLFDAFSLGGTLVLAAGLAPPPKFAQALAQGRPTILTGPPLLFRFLLKLRNNPAVMAPLRESVRYLEVGLDRAPLQLFADLREAFPQATLINRYGQTECAGPAAMRLYPPDRPLPRSIACGRSPFVELADRSDGDYREIVLTGPGLMQGYWPDLDRPASHPSGDLALVDQRGDYRLVDRRDNLFQSAGERVSPAEIEAAVLEWAEVNEAVVVPVSDQALGARPAVCYYSARGLAPEELLRRLNGRLPAHMTPARCLALPGRLPRNEVGKIDLIEIKKLIDEKI